MSIISVASIAGRVGGYAPLNTSLLIPASYLATSVSAMPFIVGDGSNVVSTGSKGSVEIPFACTIIAARLFADVTGSIVVDVKRATYSGLPTFSSICGSAKPTLSAAQKVQDTTLTGWTTGLAAGDWLQINIDSATTIKLATLSLTILRS